jgi:16S rRNA processing protein RimM
VAGVHGTDGDIRISPESDNPLRFETGAFISIIGRNYKITSSRQTTRTLLIHLEGVESETKAKELVHFPAFVAESDVLSPPKDTYYHFQLIGLTVYDTFENSLGTLMEVLNTGANDVYIVRTETSEILLPAITEVIKSVRIPEGTMVVDLPLGLESRSITTTRSKTARRHHSRKQTPTTQTRNGN